MCHFQIQKMSYFEIRECAISKYENVLWSVCIFKYECYLFLQQTARHTRGIINNEIWFMLTRHIAVKTVKYIHLAYSSRVFQNFTKKF